MTERKVLIVIPACNEAGNIGRTIRKVRTVNAGWDILVVDDGSRDATATEARAESVDVVSLPFNLGVGGAMQTGFHYALGHGYDGVVRVDADGQHDPGFIPDLLEALAGGADICVGSRFLPPHLGYRSSVVRRAGIHFFSGLISFLTGCRVTDPTSGFRAYNRAVIRIFARHYPHDYPEPEAIVLAARWRCRIVEIPVKMCKREEGNSSIRYLMTLYYMIKVTSAILLDMIKKRNSPECLVDRGSETMSGGRGEQ